MKKPKKKTIKKSRKKPMEPYQLPSAPPMYSNNMGTFGLGLNGQFITWHQCREACAYYTGVYGYLDRKAVLMLGSSTKVTECPGRDGIQSAIDKVSKKLGIDPVDVRPVRIAGQPNDMLCTFAIELGPWWSSSWIRFNLLTLILRLTFMGWDGEDPEKFAKKNTYLRAEWLPIFNAFMEGRTVVQIPEGSSNKCMTRTGYAWPPSKVGNAHGHYLSCIAKMVAAQDYTLEQLLIRP